MHENISLDRPWLEFDLQSQLRVLSWSLNRPGFTNSRRIVWREVSNAELPKHLDVRKWLAGEIASRGISDAVVFLTSRDVRSACHKAVAIDDIEVQAVATVGLLNAERVGHRRDWAGQDWGTINVAVRINHGLSHSGLLEAMSLVVQARTAAVIDIGIETPFGLATGTGTDCAAVAAPPGDIHFCGLHTEVGEATGRAVYDAVLQGARAWQSSRGRILDTSEEP